MLLQLSHSKCFGYLVLKKKETDKGREYTKDKAAYFKAVFSERANTTLPISCN